MAGQYALGIDFGGTKVLAAVVDLETGKVLGEGERGGDRQEARRVRGRDLDGPFSPPLRNEVDSGEGCASDADRSHADSR